MSCPPHAIYSPIRVEVVVKRIDASGWQHVDLRRPAQVKILQPNHPGDVIVRLPHDDGVHHWECWRKFKSISAVSISKNY